MGEPKTNLGNLDEKERAEKILGKKPLNKVQNGNAEKVQKGAGINLIGGRPQAQFTGYTRIPGQVPNQTPPLAERHTLDPETEQALNGKPPPWNLDRHFDRHPLTTEDVIRGLGLSKALEQRLTKIVAREILSSSNHVQLTKALLQTMLTEGLDPEVRRIISTRSNQLYKKVIQKAGFTEVYRPKELTLLHKAQAQRAGVKYVAKVQRGGKTRYFYDEGKYRAQHGRHISGQEGATIQLHKDVLRCVSKTGGCGIDAFKTLTKKYGAKEAHRAVRAAVESGELSFKNGKFSTPESKSNTKASKAGGKANGSKQ